VLPSIERSEAFGIVQLEALAAGLPVISTELGTGTSWVNQHAVTGLVVPPRDPAALAAAITRLLNDPAERTRLGAAGQRRVWQEFSVDQMVRRVEAVYREALGGAIVEGPVRG
jgi:rhamnosyl/mannosyltransferase